MKMCSAVAGVVALEATFAIRICQTKEKVTDPFSLVYGLAGDEKAATSHPKTFPSIS